MDSGSRVFITGATGFVGRHLARVLTASRTTVHALKRPTSKEGELRELGCVFFVGCLEDETSLKRAMAGCEVVFHCAGVASFSAKYRQALYDVNVVGTRRLLKACLDSGVKQVIVTSATAALGIPGDSMVGDEETVWNWQPYNVGYMETKYQQLQEVEHFAKLGLPIVTVMPGLIIGEGDHTGCASRSGQLMNAIREGKAPGYPSGGITAISVDDVVRGHILAAQNGRPGQRYILGGSHLTYREIFELIAEVVGTQIPPIPFAEEAVIRLGDLYEVMNATGDQEPVFTRELAVIMSKNCYYSDAKAKRELGYSALDDARKQIKLAMEWYLSNGYV